MVLSAKLDRIHSGQLTLSAQVKDLRESLPMQRRPLSRWVQQIHVEVLKAKRGSLCRACESMQVYDESGRLPMLFMVIERFKSRDTRAVSERFRRFGRMFPDGVAFHGSWVDSTGARCFQLIEGPNLESLNLWASRWDDLIEFEIVPVQPFDDFWSTVL